MGWGASRFAALMEGLRLTKNMGSQQGPFHKNIPHQPELWVYLPGRTSTSWILSGALFFPSWRRVRTLWRFFWRRARLIGRFPQLLDNEEYQADRSVQVGSITRFIDEFPGVIVSGSQGLRSDERVTSEHSAGQEPTKNSTAHPIHI